MQFLNHETILFGSRCECGGFFTDTVKVDVEERIVEGSGRLLCTSCTNCKQTRYAHKDENATADAVLDLKETSGERDLWLKFRSKPEEYPKDAKDIAEFQRFARLLNRIKELKAQPTEKFKGVRSELETYTRTAASVYQNHLDSKK